GDVVRARAVAGLAPDGEIGPGRRVAVMDRVVVPPQVRRVAVRAYVVPVLLEARPVQRIAMVDVLVGIQMKPAPAARLLRSRVPGDRERLHPAVRERDEVLLQRVDAEGVLDLEVGEGAVRAVGAYEEAVVPAEEGRGHAVVRDGRVVEVAEHGRRGGRLHRVRVLGVLPGLGLRAMAGDARVVADELGRWGRGRG